MHRPHYHICLFFALVWAFLGSPRGATIAAEPSEQTIGRHLVNLKSPDVEVRHAALWELQTSLDPRIPDAMIPLLSDEGNSIRRLAARAIGSRWWQIPKERVPIFIKALQRNEATEHADERNMLNRAIGLLNRDYKGNMLAHSANKRWVIYERRKLPCLIDVENESEELLGWPPEPEGLNWLSAAFGNETLERSVLWHPQDEIVAFDIVLHRYASTAWVWRHRTGLRKLEPQNVINALGYHASGRGDFYTTLQEWEGDALLIEVDYADKTAVVAWNPLMDTVRVVSTK